MNPLCPYFNIGLQYEVNNFISGSTLSNNIECKLCYENNVGNLMKFVHVYCIKGQWTNTISHFFQISQVMKKIALYNNNIEYIQLPFNTHLHLGCV